jgi:hypothetical protein
VIVEAFGPKGRRKVERKRVRVANTAKASEKRGLAGAVACSEKPNARLRDFETEARDVPQIANFDRIGHYRMEAHFL